MKINRKLSLLLAAGFLGAGILPAGLQTQGKNYLSQEAAWQAEAAAGISLSRSVKELALAPEDYENIAVSRVSDYVNIRKEPNTSSTIVGKIYNNCAATILQTVDGEDGKWYQIQSGSVSGYMKAQYFITGAQAEAVAKEIGTEYATINTASLRLRSEPNLESDTLTMLTQGAEYVVLEEKDNFAKLSVDEDMTGYVSMDYIKTRVEFKQAVSLEEEANKAAEEAKRKQAAAAAIQELEAVKMVEAKDNQTTSSEQTGAPAAGDLGGATTIAANTAGTAASTAAATKAAVANGTIAASPIEDKGSPTAAAPTNAATAAATKAASSNTAVGPGGSSSNTSSGSSTTTSSSGVTYGPGGNASTAVVSATRTAIVAYAKQFLGNPYVYGGTSLTSGTDCSGFVMRIYEHFGITTGRSSRDQAANVRTISVDEIQPGDLLFYASGDYINHVAMYIGGGQVIHAASSKTGIIISPSNYRTAYKAGTFLN